MVYIHPRCIAALRDTHDEIVTEHVQDHPHDMFGLGERDVTGKLFIGRDRCVRACMFLCIHVCVHACLYVCRQDLHGYVFESVCIHTRILAPERGTP
jgi:hypothetical protein